MSLETSAARGPSATRPSTRGNPFSRHVIGGKEGGELARVDMPPLVKSHAHPPGILFFYFLTFFVEWQTNNRRRAKFRFDWYAITVQLAFQVGINRSLILSGSLWS